MVKSDIGHDIDKSVNELTLLIKIRDFAGLAFKLLFLNQLKSSVAKACNSNSN